MLHDFEEIMKAHRNSAIIALEPIKKGVKQVLTMSAYSDRVSLE